MSLQGSQLIGVYAVAIAATLSLTATSGFFVYLAALGIVKKIGGKYRDSAEARLAFLSTPFGVMFVNLMIADFIQAVGFSMNYVYVAYKTHTLHPQACAAQGIFIQIGDVASALSNFLIALQTFLVLHRNTRYRPTLGLLYPIIVGVWLLVFLLAVIGPLTHGGAWAPPTGFFDWSGEWCWISARHEDARLYLHYLWLFIAVFGSTALYLFLFWRLRGWRYATNDVASSGSATTVTDVRASHANAAAQKNKTLNRAARYMLLYPIVFILLLTPLSAYRLAGVAGHTWPLPVMSTCGAIFALSGFADLLLFGLTRKVLISPRSRSGKANGHGKLWVHVHQDTVVACDSLELDNGMCSSPSLADALSSPGKKALARIREEGWTQPSNWSEAEEQVDKNWDPEQQAREHSPLPLGHVEFLKKARMFGDRRSGAPGKS